MGVNTLPKTVTRQRRCCDLNPGPSAPEFSMLTTRLPSHRKILDEIKRSCSVLQQFNSSTIMPIDLVQVYCTSTFDDQQ